MTFQRIHTDTDWWFCVFRADQTGEHVLLRQSRHGVLRYRDAT